MKQREHTRRVRSGKGRRWRIRKIINKGIKKKSRVFGKNMPAQLHIGTLAFDPRKIQPVFPLADIKPGGGFWTSTYTPKEERISDWARWVPSNIPDMATAEEAVLVRPTKNSKIYRISTKKDIRDLFTQYGTVQDMEGYGGEVLPTIDWKEFTNDYDALHVTKNAVNNIWGKTPIRTKEGISGRAGLTAFDTESTVWFKDVFKKQKPINPVSAEKYWGYTTEPRGILK